MSIESQLRPTVHRRSAAAPCGLAATDLPRQKCYGLQRFGCADGSGKDKDMTDPKDMSDPQVRPPFWHHRYYYLALKIIVLLAGVLIALRIVGLW